MNSFAKGERIEGPRRVLAGAAPYLGSGRIGGMRRTLIMGEIVWAGESDRVETQRLAFAAAEDPACDLIVID